MLWLLSHYTVPGSMLTISMLKAILHNTFFDSFQIRAQLWHTQGACRVFIFQATCKYCGRADFAFLNNKLFNNLNQLEYPQIICYRIKGLSQHFYERKLRHVRLSSSLFSKCVFLCMYSFNNSQVRSTNMGVFNELFIIVNIDVTKS